MAGILDVFDRVTVMNDFACILESCEISDFRLDMKKQSAVIHLTAETLVPKRELYEFIEQTKSVYELKELEIKIKYKSIEFSDEYYRNMLMTVFKKCSICRAFLINSKATLENDVLKISNVKCGKELLESNMYSVTEAAIRAGYTEMSHFSRKFKSLTGISPSEYKKSAQ